jgi:hypothetical protein
MNRRQFFLTGIAFIGAGCIESSDPPNDAGTPNDAESSASPTTSPKPTENCPSYLMVVGNEMGREVTVYLSVTATGSRHRAMDSPTATRAEDSTPEETPVETFSDSFTLPIDAYKRYDSIQMKDGDHILSVDVENGPEGKWEIHRGMFGRHEAINVNIAGEEEIYFSYPTIDRTCNGTETS